MAPSSGCGITLQESERVVRLTPPTGSVRMVLDSDAGNQSDDQFAVVHALLSPNRLHVEALYAAPFHNVRCRGPAAGMEQSLAELQRLLEFVDGPRLPAVHPGSAAFLPQPDQPIHSDAAHDLVARALDPDRTGPLYVAAIGAPTNPASAILLKPEIIRHLIVVWLGGQPLHHPDVTDFNARQDPYAVRVLLDSGVPLVHIPCAGVAELLSTSVPELERLAAPSGQIGAYLTGLVAAESVEGAEGLSRAKILWDLAPIAWLLQPDWVPTVLTHSPILTDRMTWSHDPGRHLIRTATRCERDPVFGDLFAKLRSRS